MSGYMAPVLPAMECEHCVNVLEKNNRNDVGSSKRKAAPLWLTASEGALTMELIYSIFF